jgi:hypothetical protein
MFIQHARKVVSIMIQGISSSGCIDTHNVLCSPSKVTFIIDQARPYLTVLVMYVCMTYQENSSIGSQDTNKKVLSSPSKVLFITDRSKRNLRRWERIREKWKVGSSRKIPLAGAEIQTQSYFALQVKRPSLVKDRKQTYSVYSAKWRVRSCRKFPLVQVKIQMKTYFSLQVPCPSLMIERNQTYCVYRAYAESEQYKLQ